jgi:hypothetical protein
VKYTTIEEFLFWDIASHTPLKQGDISQNAELFITTAMRTSNPVYDLRQIQNTVQ